MTRCDPNAAPTALFGTVQRLIGPAKRLKDNLPADMQEKFTGEEMVCAMGIMCHELWRRPVFSKRRCSSKKIISEVRHAARDLF